MPSLRGNVRLQFHNYVLIICCASAYYITRK